MDKKLYVLVRNDLDLAYQGVQAGHVVAEWMKDFYGNPDYPWHNGTLVYLQVDDIREWDGKLWEEGVDYSAFIEPDIGNEMTALAVLGHNELFSKLKLMGR